MSVTSVISDDELPMESEEFATRLAEEIDEYIDEHELATPRFDERLSLEEMREGLYTRIYNEIAAIDLSRRMLEQVDEVEDAQVFIHLLKQIEDEAKHARMLSQRLQNLGGDPQKVFERADESTREFWEMFDGLDIIETIVMLQCGTERMAQYRHELELEYYDEETAEIYKHVIAPEEKFHAQIGVNMLRKLCTDLETQQHAIQKSRDGREMIRQFHDKGVQNAYKKGVQ